MCPCLSIPLPIMPGYNTKSGLSYVPSISVPIMPGDLIKAGLSYMAVSQYP